VSEKDGEIVELDLDEETVERLTAFAKERNETIDDTVNFILRQYIDKIHTVTISDLERIISDADTEEKVKETFNQFYLIVNDFKDPIARMVPIWATNDN
jgi:hypothetical protein